MIKNLFKTIKLLLTTIKKTLKFMRTNLPKPQNIKLYSKNQSPDIKNMSPIEIAMQRMDLAVTLTNKILSLTKHADNASSFINYLKNNDPVARERFTNETLAEFVELADAYHHLSVALEDVDPETLELNTVPLEKKDEIELQSTQGLSLNDILEAAFRTRIKMEERMRQQREENTKLH